MKYKCGGQGTKGTDWMAVFYLPLQASCPPSPRSRCPRELTNHSWTCDPWLPAAFREQEDGQEIRGRKGSQRVRRVFTLLVSSNPAGMRGLATLEGKGPPHRLPRLRCWLIACTFAPLDPVLQGKSPASTLPTHFWQVSLLNPPPITQFECAICFCHDPDWYSSSFNEIFFSVLFPKKKKKIRNF